jgi:PIN domain nuclease of toxin-antitoxin system
MAVNLKLGKLQMDVSLGEAVETAVRAGLQVLDLRVDAVCRTLALDLNHRDPFDRILAAQALTHGLALVSRDPVFDAWAVPHIW